MLGDEILRQWPVRALAIRSIKFACQVLACQALAEPIFRLGGAGYTLVVRGRYVTRGREADHVVETRHVLVCARPCVRQGTNFFTGSLR